MELVFILLAELITGRIGEIIVIKGLEEKIPARKGGLITQNTCNELKNKMD